MRNKPQYIRERFPDNDHILDILMTEDPEFRDLCKDHDACVDALHFWTRSKEAEAEVRVVEYRELIQELEDEIKQAFAAMKSEQRD